MKRALYWVLDRLVIGASGWAELAEIVEDYKKEVAARPKPEQQLILPLDSTTTGGW